MMDTRYYCWSINRSGKEGTDAERDSNQEFHAFQHSVFQKGEDRPKNSQGHVPCHKNRHQRGYKQIKHLRYDRVQLFLQLRHKKYGDNDRNYMALITGKVNVIEAKPYGGGGNRLGSRHCPCIQQIRMDHNHTDHGSQKPIAAENLCRTERDQDRKEGKCRTAHQMKNRIGA